MHATAPCIDGEKLRHRRQQILKHLPFNIHAQHVCATAPPLRSPVHLQGLQLTDTHLRHRNILLVSQRNDFIESEQQVEGGGSHLRRVGE